MKIENKRRGKKLVVGIGTIIIIAGLVVGYMVIGHDGNVTKDSKKEKTNNQGFVVEPPSKNKATTDSKDKTVEKEDSSKSSTTKPSSTTQKTDSNKYESTVPSKQTSSTKQDSSPTKVDTGNSNLKPTQKPTQKPTPKPELKPKPTPKPESDGSKTGGGTTYEDLPKDQQAPIITKTEEAKGSIKDDDQPLFP